MFSGNFKYWFHATFWVFYTLLVTIVSGSLNSFPLRFYFMHELVNLPVYIGVSYFIVYFLIPKNFEKKQWPVYSLIMLVMVAAGAFVCQLIEHYIYFGFILSSVFENEDWLNSSRFLSNVWIIAIPVFILSARKFYMDWQESKKGKEAVEKLQLKTELQLLRLQLNPHFLFNTLNNLYALTISKDDKAPDVVAKLSEILRFLIYDSNTQLVSLDSEISLIENYIDLERLRYGERLENTFKIDGNSRGIMIPPLLLFTFVENAFKHGVSNDMGNPKLDIRLTTKNSFVHFRIKNTKPPEPLKQANGGIGLANLQKRLRLMYDEKYKLHIEDNEQLYAVDLKLYLE